MQLLRLFRALQTSCVHEYLDIRKPTHELIVKYRMQNSHRCENLYFQATFLLLWLPLLLKLSNVRQCSARDARPARDACSALSTPCTRSGLARGACSARAERLVFHAPDEIFYILFLRLSCTTKSASSDIQTQRCALK